MPLGLGLALAGALLLIPAARRGLGRLAAAALRTVCALGALAALRVLGLGAMGLTLGVNLFNALAMGALGLPGLGLLLMLNWMTRG